MCRRLRLAALAAVAFVASAGLARAGDLRVMSAGAVKEAVTALASDFARKSGEHVAFTVQRFIACCRPVEMLPLPLTLHPIPCRKVIAFAILVLRRLFAQVLRHVADSHPCIFNSSDIDYARASDLFPLLTEPLLIDP